LTKFESVELAPAGAGRANAEIWLRLSRADVDPHVLRCPPTMHPHLAQHWADELSVRIDELGARARYAAAAARAGGSNSDAAVLHAHEASRAAASVRPHLSAELALALDALTLLPDTLLRISIPDPLRHPSAHVLTLTLATAWLGAQAYAMTFCLDSLSCALGVSQMVAGNTLGAVGASLPNLVAVVITARQGLPTRSLAQAIGANTFNILVGLGSVWLVQALGGRCKYGAHSTIEGDCAGCFMPVGFEHACPRLDAGGVRGAGAAVGPVLPPGSVLGSALVIYMCIALLAGALLVGCGALSRPAALVLVACYALWFAYQLAASLGAVATLCVLGDVCL
jgi:Ca2+/Na+ antiporter